MVIDQLTQDQFAGVLDIDVWAAGTTGLEQLELVVAGETVATFESLGDGAYSGAFIRHTVNIDGVDADDVRLRFVNDFYDEATGADRNVRVDRVVIDGQSYQTETSKVYSTGTTAQGFPAAPAQGFPAQSFPAGGAVAGHSPGGAPSGHSTGGLLRLKTTRPAKKMNGRLARLSKNMKRRLERQASALT